MPGAGLTTPLRPWGCAQLTSSVGDTWQIQSEIWISEEFVWSQDWQSIKGNFRIFQSSPGLIYVCLKDAN